MVTVWFMQSLSKNSIRRIVIKQLQFWQAIKNMWLYIYNVINIEILHFFKDKEVEEDYLFSWEFENFFVLHGYFNIRGEYKMRSRKGYVKELGSCPYTFLRVFTTRYFFWKYRSDSLIHSENRTKNITQPNVRKSRNGFFFTLLCTRYYLQAVPINIYFVLR